jgi:phosphate-selective porin OprO/OprP
MPLTRKAHVSFWTALSLLFLFPAPGFPQRLDARPGRTLFDRVTLRPPPQTPPPQGLVWDNRPVVRAGPLEVSLRARLQADHRSSDAPFLAPDESAFSITRRRIGVEGSLAGVLDFEIEREINADDPWRDVFVNYSQFDAIQVQAGKFKIPFSLDELTSVVSLDFVLRSMLGSYLSPGRDRGVMLHGRVLDRIVRYEIGWFAHDGDNARAANPERVRAGRTTAVRIGVQPLRRLDGPGSDLQIAANWTTSDLPEGLPGIRGRTAFEQVFFPSEYPVLGARTRRGVDVRVRPGPFSARAEWAQVRDERLEMSVEDTALSPIRATAWYVSGAWIVTGEDKDDRIDPARPFLQGGLGALEVAVRLEDLRFASGNADEEPSTSPRAEVIVGNAVRAVTVGANWYLNRWIKVQFNVIRERVEDPARGPLPSQPSYWSRVLRLQFVL